MNEDQSALTPAVLGLLALLSIGGILFLGWEAKTVNNAIIGDYVACCTTAVRGYSPTGLRQAEAITTTENCESTDTPEMCCAKNVAIRSGHPIQVIGARSGSCLMPKVEYPAQTSAVGYSICCTTEEFTHAPTGYWQGQAKTDTFTCWDAETPGQCCVRASGRRFIGAREGACNVASPQKNYPVWVGNTY